MKPFLVEAKNCDIDVIRKSNPASYITNAASDSDSPSSATSPQYSEAMRDNVLRELLETEENYVKLLSSICFGYASFDSYICVQFIRPRYEEYSIDFFLTFIQFSFLKELRQRPDVFPTESLILIFSNIEKIYRFQQRFLDAMRYGVENNRIVETFLEYVIIIIIFY